MRHQIEWFEAVEVIKRHVFEISTQWGSGTGFLVSHIDSSRTMCAIATAAHVVKEAHDWEQPIRIHHVSTGKMELLHSKSRAVFLEPARDTAAILLMKPDIPLPDYALPLQPKGSFLPVGNKIGWLGFPGIKEADPCFFSGRISARMKDNGAYLVDGVAVSGVSGSPAFWLGTENLNQLLVIGVVTAYIPDTIDGKTYPGLSMVQGVEQFNELCEDFATIAQAKSKETQPARWRPANENKG